MHHALGSVSALHQQAEPTRYCLCETGLEGDRASAGAERQHPILRVCLNCRWHQPGKGTGASPLTHMANDHGGPLRRAADTAGSVEVPATRDGAAQTWDLVIFVRELVVVGDLLVDSNRLLGVDDNLLLPLHRHDFGVTVRLPARETIVSGSPAACKGPDCFRIFIDKSGSHTNLLFYSVQHCK